MKSIMKLFGILMILAVVSLSGCIGEDVTADEESYVVIEDVLVEDSAEEPIADESDDAVEIIDPVEDNPDDVIISKPSPSGNLVAGVDGSSGHGDEIKAKREAAEAAKIAAEEAERVRLEALSATLPAAINASEEASLAAFEAEAIYNGACYLLAATEEATEEANAILISASATTLEVESRLLASMELIDALEIVCDEAEANLLAWEPYAEDSDASFELYMGLAQTYDNAAIAFNAELGVYNAVVGEYNLAVEAEIAAEEALEDATDAQAPHTPESVEALRIAAEEFRETADATDAALEEAQEAYDILNPVEETEE